MKQFRLPKEFAEKWIQALRDYKGIISRTELYDGEGMDALGIAGTIVGIPLSSMKSYGAFLWYYGMANFRKLPNEIKGWDVNSLPRVISFKCDQVKSLSEIADWIEDNVEFY